MTVIRHILPIAVLLVLPFRAPAAPGLPDDIEVDESIPAPADVLGYRPGQRHPQHHEIVAYLRRLADASDRVHIEEIGTTHGRRPQLLLTFATPERLARIDEIRAARHDASVAGDGPPVVWLGYAIHGDEASGASAALVMAWYLAAGRDERVAGWLDEMVIVMEPAINPDGIDRFADWVNMHRGRHPSPDPNDREHEQGWPSARTNYYWFDLNRDWMPLVHPESQNRVRHYHRWRPHLITDHHEMGRNSTYFFQPGIPERANPLIADANQALTATIAEFHGAELDAAGEPYYTRESFDDFYIGKGSTYPDVTGGIGILFEQASSRGVIQDSDYGRRHFADTVANQVRTSLSSLDGARANADELIAYQRDFFERSAERADDFDGAGWLIGDGGDPARAHALLATLLNHDITVHPVDETVTIDERAHEPGSAWFIPARQPHYLLLESMLEPVTDLAVETFYDVSAWPMAMAHDLPIETPRRRPEVGAALGEAPSHRPSIPETEALAWLIPWSQYRADALLADLLSDGYRVQVFSRPATLATRDGERVFERGTLLVHAGLQPETLDAVGPRLASLARTHGVDVFAAERGLAVDGIDLGSPSAEVLEPVRPALLTGHGVSAYGAGAVWHWFDTRLAEPVTQLDLREVDRSDLGDYTHLIMPPGWYGAFDDDAEAALSKFVREGGVIIAFGSAAERVEDFDLKWSLAEADAEGEPDGDLERRPYADYRQDYAREIIGGSALRVELDTTHPLGWGYDGEELVLFRQGRQRLRPVDNPYAQVAVYAEEPLAAGYLSDDNAERLAGTPAVSVSRHGRGAVVRIADEPLFRGYWRGGEKLFANALFFSALVSTTELPDPY
jgi:hypothetical protein